MRSTLTSRTTLVAILAAAGLAAGAALAQPPGYAPGTGPGYGPGVGPCGRAQGMGPRANWDSGDWVQGRLDRMASRLNLTAEQKARLEPILRQRQELRATQQAAMRQEISAILTPEQRAQFDQLGPGRGGWRGRGMGYGPGPATTTPVPANQP
jgi:Spy/CpxP family protein refolding chaperone